MNLLAQGNLIIGMASQDKNLTANLVGSLAYFFMVNSVTVTLCYGFAASLFYNSFRILIDRREESSKARKFLLGLSCFMFLMNTGLFVANVAFNLTLFSWAGDPVTESTPPIEDRMLASQNANIPYSICEVLFEIVNFIVGDAIVLWRAAILWPHSRLVQCGLWFLLLADVGVSMSDLIISSRGYIQVNAGNNYDWAGLDAARILTSLGVNFLATSCIAVKAWQFRRTLKLGLSKPARKKSLVNQVLTLMIECGFIFCTIQLFYTIYTLAIVKKSYNISITTRELFQAATAPFFAFFAGMYPSIVIVVVTKQRSILGECTFVGRSQGISAGIEENQQPERSRALSTLHFQVANHSETGRLTDPESQTIQSGVQGRQIVERMASM